MSVREFIVCESTSRWAAALRLALAREPALRAAGVRLYETRQLGDLTKRLAERPNSFVAVEVRTDNVGDVLGWLSQAAGQFGRVRCVALMDRSLATGEREVFETLCEAGALEAARSPRKLRAVVELFLQHARVSKETAKNLAADLPLEEQLWALLPWQAERSRIG